jgi:hypothetical protein
MRRKTADEMQAETSGGSGRPFAFAGGTAVLPSREVQHAWFELTRARPWRSVALVPVEDTCSTLNLAHEMAQMASLDPRNRVLVVNATGVVGDPAGVARTPVNPEQVDARGGAVSVANDKYWLLDCAKLGLDDATVGMVEVPRHVEEMRAGTSPYTMIIVATSSVLTRPAAVSTARSVETVVLCVTLSISSFGDAKRSIDLVGEENVVGTIAMRPRS